MSPKKQNIYKRWFTVPRQEKTAEPASYRTMLRYATKYDYFLLTVGLVSSIINGIMNPLNMIAFQGVVDVLNEAETEYKEHHLDKDKFTAGIQKYTWIYFGIGCFVFALTFVGMGALFTLTERQVKQIRKHFLQSIINQEIEWFDKNEVGALTHKMSSNIEKIKDGTSDKPAILLQALGALFSGVILAFIFSWRLTLVVIVIVPFVILSLYGSARAVSAAIHKEMNAYSAAGAVAEEVISGIRTVMSFNAQDFEVERYKRCLNKGKTVGIRKAGVTGFFAGLYNLILFVAMGVSFWYGTQLVVWRDIKPGTVFSVFWAVLIGAMRMGMAVPQISVIVGAKMAAGELFSIIDRVPKLDSLSPAGQKIDNVKGKIEFSNVHFRYPSRPEVKVLNGVSWSVEPGQTIALVGHSGCGKSTSIGLLMRYYNPESGSITIDGVPIEDLNVEWLRNTIGVVSQESVVFQATVAENLRMGKPDATVDELESACHMANAHNFIMKLPSGYDTFIGDGGVRLSGGQKQRLAIARALVRQPKILLLDEATSALDTESERLVQAALDAAATGRTTVTIAHRLSTVRNANKIIVFDQGNILEAGTHEELMKLDGFYRQLVAAQQVTGDSKPSIEPIEESDVEEGQLSKSASIRASERVRKSIASVRDTEGGLYLDDAMDDMEQEGSHTASLMDIARFARPEAKLAIGGFVLSLIRGAAWPCFSILYGQLFLTLAKTDLSHAVSQATLFAVLFACVGLFGGIATFASGFLLGSVGEKVSMRLRLGVYRNILRQDGAYFDERAHSVGALTSRLAQDASNVQAAIDQRLAEVLQGITTLICGLAIAFSVSWCITPFCLLIALILVIIQTQISAFLKRRGVQDAEIASTAGRIVTESIENVKTIQAMTRQVKTFEDFNQASELPHKRAIVRGLINSVSYAISTSYVSFNFFASYLFGMFLVNRDWVSPFAVFQAIEALNMAAILISNSAAYFPEFIKARISAGLMFGMMRMTPKVDSAVQHGIVAPIQGNIELNKVKFAYPSNGRTLTLNGLDIRANFGQTVALVGPSGCGKSTVIQLVERFYDVLGGVLKVDGTDSRLYNVQHLRKSIALVGQEPTLFNLSIRENIAYGSPEIDDAKVIAAAKMANIDSFVQSLPAGYNTSAGARGMQLSGGQRQRVAIARAIFREPRILLLDEATAALDGESEKLVQEALDHARLGRTCITVAHRLSTIQNADLICVIDSGKCVESGTHDQLVERRGLYYRLVQSQTMS
uniref:ABC-type xenobiotic transporter n=1 Tax=Panagrellus redivivus TaxID=6233 RepID=A0A7E4UP36_PANRE